MESSKKESANDYVNVLQPGRQLWAPDMAMLLFSVVDRYHNRLGILSSS